MSQPTILLGDCLDVMATMPAESVDAVVTDPPYGLAFMGQHWDAGVPGVDFWSAMYRVARPGSYLLAFGGTRTIHRIAVAIEDAGWVIRDMVCWVYASGYPKSRASLKPAWEPIVMARKAGPPRDLAIEDCRIPFESDADAAGAATGVWGDGESSWYQKPRADYVPVVQEKPGRWPANVMLTDPVFDGDVEGVVGGGVTTRSTVRLSEDHDEPGSTWSLGRSGITPRGVADAGTYSRFFIIPKAGQGDREPVLGGLPERELASTWGDLGPVEGNPRKPDTGHLPSRMNYHPTVKPTDLMRHLVRLVTPLGGTVLDPFVGSGTTVIAAEMEGFDSIGIEREAGYVAIAEARLNGTQLGLGL